MGHQAEGTWEQQQKQKPQCEVKLLKKGQVNYPALAKNRLERGTLVFFCQETSFAGLWSDTAVVAVGAVHGGQVTQFDGVLEGHGCGGHSRRQDALFLS